ncbi:LacI family transcriptional regulator [Orbus hercynius]|uniref:LacI family transcriptional regulator n=1 Tax=Orbus hercynius TaxID=593135 RepID=A0A495RJY1_9GAMM|nr:catabolite repressor/activator [Orbus hercynius]RKS87827.1 LacI family transcriptional regulator [Orbus hercynius]
MKLDEIAQLAGVSKTTASYVINGKAKHHRVSDKTIAKVMEIVKQHNFQPNAVAAGLRAGRTYSIGLIIPDLENISYTRIANHLEHKVRQAGYQLLISCSEDDPEIEKKCILHLKQRHADAIIVSSSFIADHSFYHNWENTNIPLFALDRPLVTTKFRNILGADKDDAKELAVEFIKFVDQDIAYIGALPDMLISRQREQGFKQGTEGKGKNINYLYAKDYTRDSAIELFWQWLDNNPVPLALFSTSFSLLQGVIDAILSKYGSLPKGMVIATFGDNELLDFLPCKVISLAQNHQQIAEVTVDTLLSSLNDQNTYQPGRTEIKRNLNYRGLLNQRYCDQSLTKKV